MRLASASLVAAVAIIAACVDTPSGKPMITGKTTGVSPDDVQAAAIAARAGALGVHPSGPAYRVHVVSKDEVEVHCGVHYGLGGEVAEPVFIVKRIHGKWQCWALKNISG
jgi:hypothetical protein